MTIFKKIGRANGFSTNIEVMLEVMRMIRSATESDPIKCIEISRKLGFSDTSTSSRVRQIILECMDYDQTFVPVAKNQGYYLARSERQVEDYIHQLNGRAKKIHERILKVQENYKLRRHSL